MPIGLGALFLAGAALHLFATTSMGIFLATLARSMPQFGLLLMLLLPLQLLSGGMTPRESMPPFVQNVMLAAPTTHFVRRRRPSSTAARASTWSGRDLLAMIGVGACFFTVVLLRFRKAVTQTQV